MKENKDGSLNLDSKDVTLLSLLQQNSQFSLGEIGRKVKLTKTGVSKRIKSLRNAGVIEGFYSKLNPTKLEQDYIFVTEVTCGPKAAQSEAVAKVIAKLPGVQSVYLTFGDYDILVICRRKDRESARRMVYKISKIRGVRNTVTIIPNHVIKESLTVDLLEGTSALAARRQKGKEPSLLL